MTNKAILSVNAGSSSVKITFYTFEKTPKVIANAQISGITAPPPTLRISRDTKHVKEQVQETIDTPQDGFKFLLKRCFADPSLSAVVGSSDNLAYICHRVVHGGDFKVAVNITEETYHHLEELEDLAPLHNFSALEIIRACRDELPSVQSVTFFDSAFHQTMPSYVTTYPIDQKIAKANHLRKYGFHGISYSFILRAVAQYLGKPAEQTNLIAMHTGSGASMCAIKEGKSIDTTYLSLAFGLRITLGMMGLTPLAGLPGATRSGDIDPSLVFHYTNEAGSLSPASTKEMHISTAEEILNKQSGWKALTGTTDFSQIAVENPPTAEHKLAFDILVDRMLGFIGNYYLKLDGQVDALVFAGGIGERSALLRRTLVEKCQSLGFAIDTTANEKGPDDDQTVMDITKAASNGKRVLICQTDEQFEMAYRCILAHGTN